MEEPTAVEIDELEEEIDEILDEEKDFISESEDIMKTFSQEIPHNTQPAENWLKTLESSYESCLDLGKVSGEMWESNQSFNESKFIKPPTSPVSSSFGAKDWSTANPSNAWPYLVDEFNDRYLRKWTNASMLVPASQVYCTWVDYFIDHHANHNYPSAIDGKWKRERKYWASRQAEVLRDTSPEHEESVMRRIQALGSRINVRF